MISADDVDHLESSQTMTCRELIDFLEEYLAGELTAEQVQSFDAHIAECLECRNYLASYRSTIRLSKSALARDDAVPDSVPEDLVKAILAARR